MNLNSWFDFLLNNKFPKGNKMLVDTRAKILEIVNANPCGVREIVQRLNLRASSIIALLKTMEDEGLTVQRNRRTERGRPKRLVTLTPLGYEFLENYRILAMKPLRARKTDLEHAEKDALYTKRLIENGHSPFKLFMELNEIAHNIKSSAETSQTL